MGGAVTFTGRFNSRLHRVRGKPRRRYDSGIVASRPGSRCRSLRRWTESLTAVSDGGLWIATTAGSGSLAIYSSADGFTTRVPLGADLQNPQFSPEGSRIAYLGVDNSLYVDSQDSSWKSPVEIAQTASAFEFSPDGEFIAFTWDSTSGSGSTSGDALGASRADGSSMPITLGLDTDGLD